MAGQPSLRSSSTQRKESTLSDQQLGISARITKGRECPLVAIEMCMKLTHMRTQRPLPTLCSLKPWMGTYHVLCFLEFKTEVSSIGHQAWGLIWLSLSDFRQSPKPYLFWATFSSLGNKTKQNKNVGWQQLNLKGFFTHKIPWYGGFTLPSS